MNKGKLDRAPHASGTKPDTSLFLGEERKRWLAEHGGIQPTIHRLIDEAMSREAQGHNAAEFPAWAQGDSTFTLAPQSFSVSPDSLSALPGSGTGPTGLLPKAS